MTNYYGGKMVPIGNGSELAKTLNPNDNQRGGPKIPQILPTNMGKVNESYENRQSKPITRMIDGYTYAG